MRPSKIQISIEIGLVLAVWLLCALSARPQEKPKVSCFAENHPETFLDGQTGKEQERDNWTAKCEIRQGDAVLYAPTRLILPYPATFRQAMDAIDEFRSKKAVEILKEKKKEKHS